MAPRPDQVQIGNYVKIRVKTADGTAATRDIGAGAAGVRYTEDAIGGAAPGIAHVAAAGSNAPTSVAVVGDDITVTLGTGGVAGTPTATAAQVVAAVNAHPAASALVTASAIGDGTGTAVAAALADLTGGVAPTFTELYGERDHSRSDEREGIDGSHKGSEHAITIPGRRSGSISLTLVANRVDVTAAEEATQSTLEDIYEAGTSVEFEQVKSFPGAPTDGSADVVKRAEGVILSFSEDASDNEVVTYDCELTLNSSLKLVA